MWTVNGVDPNTYGLKVSGVPGWESAPALEYLTQPVPGKAGNVLLRATPQVGPRRMVMSGTVIGSSNADMLTKFDQLKALFSAPSLVVVMNNRATRQITCRLDGAFDFPDIEVSMVTRKMPVSFALVADDPWWYDIADSVVADAGVAPGTAMVLGSAPSLPLISSTATGSVGSLTLTLYNSAAVVVGSLTITFGFVVGNSAVVDMRNKTILVNGVSHMEYLTAGDFFSLDAVRDGNYLTAAWPFVSRSASFTTQLNYKKAWR